MIDVNSLIEKLIEQYKNNLNETQVIEIRNSYIKTVLNPLYSQLKSVPNEQKGELGKSINELKIRINEISDAKIEEVRKISEISDHKVDYDISIETSLAQKGSLNPLTLVLNEIIKYFKNLNFTIQTGEEITKVKYNFDHLNVPEIHPTRDTSESFYINATTMLRTQNTATSAEVLENNSNSDIRIMNYGYVYRNDDDDASHSHQFNQIDFIWVREGLNIRNLKWFINGLVKHIYGETVKTRFRLSNFPFTEPSFEVDATCPFCHGEGCTTCKHSGWIEILGCGMFHENVMKASNVSIKTGIAAGLGLDRIAMIKYGIKDVRDLYSNDFRVMEQFVKENK